MSDSDKNNWLSQLDRKYEKYHLKKMKIADFMLSQSTSLYIYWCFSWEVI